MAGFPAEATANVGYGDRSEENVEVKGIDPDWHQIENRTVTLGRPFTYVDVSAPKSPVSWLPRSAGSIPTLCDLRPTS